MSTSPATVDAGRRSTLATVGLWTPHLDSLPIPEAQRIAKEIEDLGVEMMWVPGDAAREALTAASAYLAATDTLTVGSGVASIYARDPLAMAAGRRALEEQFGDRYHLGLGVSHSSFVARRGQKFQRPLAAMNDYLDRMAAAASTRHEVQGATRTVLGALGPRMQDIAGEKADGVLTYNASVSHTRATRERLGGDALVVVTQVVCDVGSDEEGDRLAREYLEFYLQLPNYVNHFRRLGFTDRDFADGGSAALVSELFVWGIDRVTQRVGDHVAAGADQVVLNVVAADRKTPPVRAWSDISTVAARIEEAR